MQNNKGLAEKGDSKMNNRWVFIILDDRFNFLVTSTTISRCLRSYRAQLLLKNTHRHHSLGPNRSTSPLKVYSLVLFFSPFWQTGSGAFENSLSFCVPEKMRLIDANFRTTTAESVTWEHTTWRRWRGGGDKERDSAVKFHCRTRGDRRQGAMSEAIHRKRTNFESNGFRRHGWDEKQITDQEVNFHVGAADKLAVVLLPLALGELSCGWWEKITRVD